jgi:hypothetical protein
LNLIFKQIFGKANFINHFGNIFLCKISCKGLDKREDSILEILSSQKNPSRNNRKFEIGFPTKLLNFKYL